MSILDLPDDQRGSLRSRYLILDLPDGQRGSLRSRYLSDAPHLPFLVTVAEDMWSYELGCWLLDVGKNLKDWEWEWIGGGVYKFGFKNEEDKVKFILKWL